MSDINLQITARGTNVSANRRGSAITIDIDNRETEAATVRANEAADSVDAKLVEVDTALTSTIRTDTADQGLSEAQQRNGIVNIGIDLMAAEGAVGGDPARDTAAWQVIVSRAALTGEKITIWPSLSGLPYLINASAIVQLGAGTLDIECVGGAKLKLADGVIVNTDADWDQHVPILRVEGGSVVRLNLNVDGNCAAQTYPATRNTFGRGSSPRRHNAAIEVFGTATHAPDVQITGRYVNGYINAVSVFFCGDVVIDKVFSALNACNGFTGAANRSWRFTNTYGFRDGYSPVYTSERFGGDRGHMQLRDWPVNLTAAGEGMPGPVFTQTAETGYIFIDNSETQQCCVIGHFVRGYERLVVGKVVHRNVGYGRLLGQEYDPTGFWAENGAINEIGTVILQANDRRPEDMPSCALRLIPSVGRMDDVSSPFGKRQGEYAAVVERVIAYCGQDWVEGGDYKAAASKKNNINKGVVVGSGVRVKHIEVEGWATSAVEAINDTFMGSERLHDVHFDYLRITNGIGKTAVSFRQYGDVVGDVERVGWGQLHLTDMRAIPDASGDDTQAVLFSTAWGPTPASAGVRLRDLRLGNIYIDGANAATGLAADRLRTAIRIHCSSDTRLKIAGGEIRNVNHPVRIEHFEYLEVSGMLIENVSRVAYVDISSTVSMTTSAGTLALRDNSAKGIEITPYQIARGASANVLTNLIDQGNVWTGPGSSNTATSQIALGTSPVNWARPDSLDQMAGGKMQWRRSGAGAPTVAAQYLGEVFVRTDTLPACYYTAVNTGAGAGDWKVASPIRTTIANHDWPSIPSLGIAPPAIVSLPGALAGNPVAVSMASGAGGLMLYGECIADGSVRVTAFNPTAAAIDLPARNMTLAVLAP